MASMVRETTFSVRTDTENDALLVPDGIETVLVNASAHRVFIPEGVEVVQLQTARPAPARAAPRAHDQGTDSPPWLLEAPDGGSGGNGGSGGVERVKRELMSMTAEAPAATEATRPLDAERSLSLPSVPGSPPAPASEEAPPQLAPPQLAQPQRAPLATNDEPDMLDEVPLRSPDPAPVVRQQPGRNGSLRSAEPLRQPLVAPPVARGHAHTHVAHGHTHVAHPKWREQFQMEHEHSRPVSRKAGRFCADVLCCWMGV